MSGYFARSAYSLPGAFSPSLAARILPLPFRSVKITIHKISISVLRPHPWNEKRDVCHWK